MIFSNFYINWIEYPARSMLLQQNERHKSVDAGSRSVFFLLIQKLQDLITSCSKKKRKKKKMKHWHSSILTYTGFNIQQEVSHFINMKERNRYMQELVRSFFPWFRNYRTLQLLVHKKIQTLIFLNFYKHWIEYSARTKLFLQDKRKKSVHERACLILLFLIQKLQELTSSCSKWFKIYFFLKCYTTLSVAVTKILDIFWKK